VSPAGDAHFLCFMAETRCLLLQLESPSAWSGCIERWSVSAPDLLALAARAGKAIRGGRRFSRHTAADFAWRYANSVRTVCERSAASPPPAWLLEVWKRMRENSAGSPSTGHLARTVGVSREHLSREFRRHYGSSVSAFARYRRLARACWLITTTSWPLAEIAYVSGFSDQSHMTRLLIAFLQITPRKLRLQSARSTSQPFKTEANLP